MDTDRSLTEADVKAIVGELKAQLVKDFQLEVGKGVLGWVKKAAILLIILAALYGISGTEWFTRASSKTAPADRTPLPAVIGKAAMRAAGVVPKGFTVIPPRDPPADILAMAERLDRINGRNRA